jgi:hypothetical protein
LGGGGAQLLHLSTKLLDFCGHGCAQSWGTSFIWIPCHKKWILVWILVESLCVKWLI